MSDHPPGLDLERLRDYLHRTHPGLLAGPLTGALIEGGKSNLTYKITDGVRVWAARRAPLGHVLATAHDMSREYRVISALAPTPVPVPGTVCLGEDPEVLGAPFYLMDFVEGAVFRTPEMTAQLTPQQAGAIADRMMDVLADLHAVEPAAVGLADFGRPDGYLQRQLHRWGKQLSASRSRDLPGIDELQDSLVARQPQQGPSGIVHGDYRLDNLIVGDAGEIAAVLDWEMSTLGDQLTDLGILLCYWDGVSALPGSVSAAVGPDSPFPHGRVLVERYAQRHDVDLAGLNWYIAFGFFKLAVILEGIYFRHQAGQTVGGGFEGFSEQVHELIALGHNHLGES